MWCSDNICMLNLCTAVEIVTMIIIGALTFAALENCRLCHLGLCLSIILSELFFCNNVGAAGSSVPCTTPLKLCLPSSGYLAAWFLHRLLGFHLQLLVHWQVRGASFNVCSLPLCFRIKMKSIEQTGTIQLELKGTSNTQTHTMSATVLHTRLISFHPRTGSRGKWWCCLHFNIK